MASCNSYRSLFFFFTALLGLTALAGVVQASTGGLKARYLHSLANFNGTIPYTWTQMYLDEKTGELFVINGPEQSIQIFDKNGMETYSFSTEEVGNVRDLAIDAGGNILLLTDHGAVTGYAIVKCNFRGDLLARMQVKGLPATDIPSFQPQAMQYRNGHLYLVDKQTMQVRITDGEANYEKGYDLTALIGLEAKKNKRGADIAGFWVDGQGNMLFTIPVLFTAYSISPDKHVQSFGEPGGRAGKFNIVAGIISDSKGRLYVTDTLRSVVMVFDRTFKFVTEFGYRGPGKENLAGPRDVVIDDNGLLYVNQLAKRGISVFQITYHQNGDMDVQ